MSASSPSAPPPRLVAADIVRAVVYALAILLLYFVSAGSTGVFIYQGF
jgi:hypothetical protein